MDLQVRKSKDSEFSKVNCFNVSEVQIDPETQNPLDVQLVRRFPLPPRLQMSGLLKMTSFHNASGEIIIVFGDRSGAGKD